MSESAPVAVIHAPTSAHVEAGFEAQRVAVAPVLVEGVINALRMSSLQMPKPPRLNSHRTRQDAIADWRNGYRTGIEHAIELLKGLVE
jgi:hypothetical protein